MADYATQNGPKSIFQQNNLKTAGPISLSYFKDNIYFWEKSKGQKCLGKSKMDKKNVQFSKTQRLYRKHVFQNQF
jgi:hypothetical protein